MTGVTDHDDLTPMLTHFRNFDVDLGHQRTCGIEHPESTRFGFGAHRSRHAMSAEHNRAAGGDFRQLIDEYRTLRPQVVDDELVVDHFVPDVDRRAVLRQRLFHDRYGAIDTCAKTAGIGENDLHGAYLTAAGGSGLRRNPSRISNAAPTVIALSAMLKAGNGSSHATSGWRNGM